MLNKVIEWSVHNRFLVLLATVFLVGAGIWAVRTTPVDAIPDLSDVQVIIQTEWAEQAPQIVEDQVTYPLTTALLAVPRATTVRGISGFGISFVYVLFEEGTDPYWARSRVLEYLSQVREQLPAGVSPQLGPDATGVGWVYQYTLESDQHDLAQLRSLQDFFVRYRLQSVPGVAEVATVGGFVMQYQVDVDPQRLQGYGIPIQRVSAALRDANADVGARTIEMTGREYMVRGLGYFRSVQDIERVVLATTPTGAPVQVRDIGHVQVGPDLRRGMADKDGRGDVVTGIVVMRHGENALKVIDAVKERLAEIERGLPQGVRIVDAYDRAPLIREAISNLTRKIGEELIMVALITALFLLHLRSSLVAAVLLPLAILLAFVVMRLIGVPANIMSMGGIAIAIGAMIDAAVVMIDNMHKHLEREDGEPSEERRWEVVVASSKEVGPALFFSLLVITVSFLPVFALEAQEGRLFKPLAWTKTLAMASAALLAITLVPVAMGYFVRGRIRAEKDNPVSRAMSRVYGPLLAGALRHRWATLGIAGLLLALTVIPFSRLGSEFMPPVEEGTILFMPMTLPGVSIQQAGEIMRRQNAILAAFPEVESVIGKAGRANTATDPAPLDMYETVVNLVPTSDWRPGVTYDGLVAEMDRATRMPGVMNIWTMPIRNRVEMLATGMRTPVGVKIFGPDLDEIERLGTAAEGLLRQVPGTRSAIAERGASGFYLDVRIDRDAAARHGLNVSEVQEVLMAAIGGTVATQTVEGRERYDVLVRYPRDLRQTAERVHEVLVPTRGGSQVPLGQIAHIRAAQGPMVVKTEDAFPVSAVFVDVEGRDLGSYVREAREYLTENLTLPAGYTIQWSGQFEAMERVRERMMLVVPVTLLLIFLLLFLHFRNTTETLIVMLTLPFALIGGVWLLWLLGYNTSVAVWVGFIALAGVAAEVGVVMLVYLDGAYRRMVIERGDAITARDIADASREAASTRLRPVMMTVVTTIGALLPLMWATGAGAATMKRIAAPMIGGLVTATLLALIVIPVVYTLWREWQLTNKEEKAMNRTMIPGTIGLIAAIGLGISACEPRGGDPPMGDMHDDMPMDAPMDPSMEGMPGMEGMMQRHADEADAMGTSVRQHVQEMRQLPPEGWHDRMGEHVGQVSRMLSLMTRHMREMDMGMGMSDEEMGRMMGMTGEEHRRMMEDMQALRAEVETLQTASRDEVRERMPAHLDRLDRMADMLEASGRAMRDM
jgi:copper/silver efflux system protein